MIWQYIFMVLIVEYYSFTVINCCVCIAFYVFDVEFNVL